MEHGSKEAFLNKEGKMFSFKNTKKQKTVEEYKSEIKHFIMEKFGITDSGYYEGVSKYLTFCSFFLLIRIII